MGAANIQIGRKVLFVGGPEAGTVRSVPESAGEYLQAEGDYIYRVWTYKFVGNKEAVHFAYRADAHPANLFVELWREYSPTVQIKRAADALTYQTLQKTAR